MGTEDEHQAVLDVPVLVQVAQRLHEALLTCVKLLFQYMEVLVQFLDVVVELADIMADGVNRLTLVVDLIIDHQQGL